MKCNKCGKQATVHLTQIVDSQITELHLCEDCAKEQSVQMEQQFGLADLLAGLSDFGKHVKEVEQTKLKCPNCGLNYEEFRKLGRLGCNACYDSFRESLSTLLKKIHGSNKHLGKAPKALPVKKEKKTSIDIEALRNQLQTAISSEDFEKAAELRDKIRTFERKGKEQ
ncbi:MAG: UvrB/UvrC motif-containing protein [Candidatus Omnitrophica bacterium]|nr:UvrB/UvrC motif-containing protein [Candidatus Omnitrophota bacterium]